MAEELTIQQKAAVTNRGGKLLVSAAAGSGKTKVLVDRILSYLMDPVNPANLDEFLIITYTKAAAAELRGKIAAKLSEKIAADPDNRHLQRQMQRLYLAKISTVHSFCGDILREYAYLVDLPADFRVADENECRQIRDNTMTQLLDRAYSQADDPDFRAFVDSQGLGRDDRLVPEILLKVYDSARCHLLPQEWLNKCIENAQCGELTDAGQTLWGQRLMEELFDYLHRQIEALSWCAEAAGRTDTMEKPAALLNATVIQLQHLAQSRTWDEVVDRGAIDFGTLRFSNKCPDMDLAERIKAVRTACKKGIEKRLRTFTDESAIVLADLQKSAAAVRGMVSLVKQFDTDYQRAKRIRRILDFGDLEHKMLELLMGKGHTGPTAVSAEIGARFREIMVDEYQDSNGVQDAIFSALSSKRNNCFMVGDVKQSIYQFRLADPQIFMDKYNTYAPADEAVDPEGRKVILSKNFRSGGAVLEGVNDIFKTCMSTAVGGLEYGEDEQLCEGFEHIPLGEPEVELWTIPVVESTYEEEAAFVAKRIVELTDGTHFVRDGKELRPIRRDDIAILLRSPGSASIYFKEALAARGIGCATEGSTNLLKTMEVAVLRSLLQVISNPRQDIPLVAVLTSPVFCVTADELAQIRGENRYCSIYDGLLASQSPKITSFLRDLTIWRREARLQSLAQLLESIFVSTRMDSIFAAMPGGQLRQENIQTFYQLAADFEKIGRRDLEQFLDYLTSMEDKGLVAAGDQNNAGLVTIMSIHKSKGLEFPVVFVSNLSRSFNRDSTRAQVLCDKDLGVGLSAVDERNRVRYPTIAKRTIVSKMVSDSLSEEMRVLYVALTRARDRLIMTYASNTLEKDIAELALRMDVGSRELLTQDVSCMGEWVLMAALRRTEAGELFALGGKPMETYPGEPAWLIKVQEAPLLGGNATLEEGKTELPSDVVEKLQKALSFQYCHKPATEAPSKQTATQRKGREKDAEASENTRQETMVLRNWRKPSFVEKETSGSDLGTATHAVMQYVRYEKCQDEAGVRQEVDRLVEENYITAEQAALVNCGQVWNFFATELGAKLRNHPNVLREFKFSILDDGKNFAPNLEGEKILLQGVVDCCLVDEDGLIILDFKTDYVTEDTLVEKLTYYRPQVEAYAEAMSRIYQKPVKEALLYFFRLNRFVTV